MKKRILTTIASLLIAAAAGFALIAAVYALPKGRMVNNIYRSHELLEHEGNYRYWAADILNTQSDNFSDSLMADIAINPNTGRLIYDAMINCYVGWSDTDDASQWLLRTAGGEPFYEGYEQVVYGRYWHGYLLWMKPLLLFFSIPEIRLINMGLQLILLCWLMILLYRELGVPACAAVGTGLLVMNPITVAMTFHFSDIYYNVLIALIVMLNHHRTFSSKNLWWMYFLWIGIAVAFFDLMTYPLASLGIPLIVYFLLTRDSLKENLISLIRFSIYWVVGYAGMWVLKWLIGTPLTGYNLIADGLGAVGLRSSGEVTNINMEYFYVLGQNFRTMFTKPFMALLAAIVLAGVLGLLFRKLSLSIRFEALVPILLVGCYPFVWYFVIRNHSIVHVWFTYRVFAVTAAAAIGVLASMVRQNGSRV